MPPLEPDVVQVSEQRMEVKIVEERSDPLNRAANQTIRLRVLPVLLQKKEEKACQIRAVRPKEAVIVEP
jgi:hypothetical protein